MERRRQPVQSRYEGQPEPGKNPRIETKPFNIPRIIVYEAFKHVKANGGGYGVDSQSLSDFEKDLSNNLYKLWNRMSSGSYYPPPVMRVEIGKSDGGIRPLGIPTVSDRIAQMVVKLHIEPELERHFHPDSYGYRPGKSAHQALSKAKERCGNRGWILDMDIKGFFEEIDHGLLMQCVRKHVKESWQLLYIQRWLTAPVQHEGGRLEEKTKGTPQGGVISPLLANLYLHYVFDVWVVKNWHGIQFERYADDIICHCVSEREAIELKACLNDRFNQCGLQLHPAKTKIAFCKGGQNKFNFKKVAFDFLGYTFRPRWIETRQGHQGLYFMAAVSQKSAKRIRQEINRWPWKYWRQKEITEIQEYCRSRLNGWMTYYGLFGKSIIRNILFHFDKRLSRWAKAKYKQLKTLTQAAQRINRARKMNPSWFPHWSSN
ncbi:MAG: group II intron reverse transcriptase/maturase [Proteobacteria bacterium]|nr:group II intron reverse transcriptase/maturase [Pseudomonadota bacterium]